MKAAKINKYGLPDVLQIEEIEKPTPSDREVLIKVVATTVSSADIRMRGLNLEPIIPGWINKIVKFFAQFIKPRIPILGTELSGVVESVGKSVKNFKAGDEVLAYPDLKMGSYVEYICLVQDSNVFLKPKNIDFSQGTALFFGGTPALDFLENKAKLEKGESVLIIGASGSVGSASVQIAKYLGAVVTGVCSGRNIETVKTIGADHVIDYKKEDFTDNGKKYDVIMDTVGAISIKKCIDSLNDGGRLLLLVPLPIQILLNKRKFQRKNKEVISGDTDVTTENLKFLIKLVSERKFVPLIDRHFSLDDIVEAHKYVEKGHKKGNVIINVTKIK